METIKAQTMKGDVRIRIEYPSILMDERFLPKGNSDQLLPWFYRILLILSFPISGVSLFLALTA